MKFNKLTAGLLALSMVGTYVPVPAPMLTVCAEEETPTSGTCGENLTWSFDKSTGTLTVSGEGEMLDYDYYTEVPWYSYASDIKTAVIEDGVTAIGESAFDNSRSLTSVTIPGSVKRIGDTAFSRCASLTSVNIPDGVTSIGNSTFSDCLSLTDVTIPDSVTSIENYAFYQCALTAVTIPDSVTSIGSNAFSYCTALTAVTIPNSVTIIEQSAFCYCKALTSVTILNPDCEFDENDIVFSNSTDENGASIFTGTISGYDNSTAQTYAEEKGCTFKSLGAAPESPAPEETALGDVSGDSKVDSSDAADLLIALAKMGAGEDAGLTDAQKAAADADGNGELNAADATVILQYAAFLGAGGEGTLQEFLASQTA